MIREIQVTPNQWVEIQIPAGNYTLLNQTQEVCYLSEIPNPQDQNLESLVFENFKFSLANPQSYWVKSRYNNTKIILVDLLVRS